MYDERSLRVEESNCFRFQPATKTPQLEEPLDRNHSTSGCLDIVSRHIPQLSPPDQETSQPPLISFKEIEGDELFRWSLEVNEVERRLRHVQKQNIFLIKS